MFSPFSPFSPAGFPLQQFVPMAEDALDVLRASPAAPGPSLGQAVLVPWLLTWHKHCQQPGDIPADQREACT